MKKMTGRDPAHGSGIEPVEIWAIQPKMMSGMGKFQQAVRKAHGVDERTKNLVELKGAQMIGCEFCLDLGSQICRNSGFSDDELLALPRYQQSELFTEREKTALDYAVGVMRTPVEVSDDLFARIRSTSPTSRWSRSPRCSRSSTSTGSTPRSASGPRGSARAWCACRRTGRLSLASLITFREVRNGEVCASCVEDAGVWNVMSQT
jgi:AhpD family alkylhydroperoxidase